MQAAACVFRKAPSLQSWPSPEPNPNCYQAAKEAVMCCSVLLPVCAADPPGVGAACRSACAAELRLQPLVPAEMLSDACRASVACSSCLRARFPREHAISECRAVLHKPVSFFTWVQQTAAGQQGLVLHSDGMMYPKHSRILCGKLPQE